MAFTNNSDTPIFVQNQILRADDLNAMVAYFEKQSQLTRIFTIGIGIVNGLEIQINDSTGELTITSGIGISSDGVLFEIDTQCTFYYYKETTVSANAFKCVDGTRGSCSDKEGQETVYEFLTSQEDDDTKDIIGLNDLGLNESHCIVLLRCEETVSRKSCFNDCEQSGADRFSQVRVLLVPTGLVTYELEGDDGTDVGTVDVSVPPKINRFGYTTNGIFLRNIDTWDALYTSYLQSCNNNAISNITSAYQSAFDGFDLLVKVNDNTPFATLNTLLTNVRNNYTSNPIPNLSDIQYCYAYFRDLTLAYEAFFKVACGLNIGINSSTTETQTNFQCAFPGYVTLGRYQIGDVVDGDGTNLNTDDCRMPFYPATASEGANERLDRAKKLYQRLIDLIKTGSSASQLDLNLKFDQLVNEEVRIIPSCTQKFGLGQQAVGGYFKLGNVRNNWNAENPYCSLMPGMVAHYNRSEIAENTLLQRFDTSDFYRIEGHLGKDLSDAESDIKSMQQRLNLPFDMRALRIGPDSSFEDLLGDDMELYFGEMQEVYQNTRADLLCKIAEVDDPNQMLKPLKDRLERITVIKNLNEVEVDGMLADATSSGFEMIVKSVELVEGILRQLYEKYDKIIEALEKAMSFNGFAEDHPGMEHLGGVYSGGTFILVYAYRFINDGVRQTYKTTYGQDLTDEELLIQALENPSDNLGDIQAAITKKVVADFCLPYACCSNTPVIRNEISQQELELFIEDKFCYFDGINPTPTLSLTPEGGTLSYFVNDDLRHTIDNATATEELNLNNLNFDAQNDFINGRAIVKIQYQLASQLIDKEVIICKRPDTEFTIVKEDKVFLDCIWMGYNYEISHNLNADEIDGGSAILTIGNSEQIVLDIAALGNPFEIFVDKNFGGTAGLTSIPVSLTAVNDICRNSTSKEIVDFCPTEVTLELFGECEVQNNGIVCVEPINTNIGGKYEFDYDTGKGYFEIRPDCPGGNFNLSIESGSISPDIINLMHKVCVLDPEGVVIPKYYFIYNIDIITQEDLILLGINPDDFKYIIEGDTEKVVRFKLVYFLEICGVGTDIEIIIRQNIEERPPAVDPGEGGDDDDPDPTDPELPEGGINNPNVEPPISVDPGTPITPGRPGDEGVNPNVELPPISIDPVRPESPPVSGTVTPGSPVNLPEDETETEGRDIVTNPILTTRSTPSKKITASTSKKTSKSKKASKPKKLSKANIELLNKRTAQQRNILSELEKDKTLVRTKPFGMAKSFLILPTTNIAIVNARFEEVLQTLSSSLTRAKGKRKTDLIKIGEAVLSNYLDKQVALSTQTINDNTKALLETYLPKLKKGGFKLGKFHKNWDGKAIKAKVVDAFMKILK